jgi:hypothetical protein
MQCKPALFAGLRFLLLPTAERCLETLFYWLREGPMG